MSVTTEKSITLVSAEALEPLRLVKLNGYYCDAEETPIGVNSSYVAISSHANVRLLTDGGTMKVEAAAAIAAGRAVYPADDGKISATPLGKAIGFAVNAATAAGDIVQIVPAEIPYLFEGKTFEAVAADKTLDIQDVGKVMYVTVDAKTITLPATAAGLDFVIMNGSSALGAVAVTVSPNANDKIMGADLAGVDNKDRINTKTTAVPGDYVHLVYGGADGYLVVDEKGTWAAEA